LNYIWSATKVFRQTAVGSKLNENSVMNKIVDKKLDRISDIWNHYILEYKFCSSKIKFTTDVKSNYFGDILGYFSDTFPLIYNSKDESTFTDNVGTAIILLQGIYVQQDLVEELLHIFKCKIEKGDLKKDKNYSINREIRNELVGHPIRKDVKDGKNQLLSSTIFSNATTENTITYLRYHVDNNYKFEPISHERMDILQRHTDFLISYFDIIILKLKTILQQFRKKIEEIEKVVESGSFENILKIVSNSFEYIFRVDYLYKPDLLRKVYKLQGKHPRYDIAIETFLYELKESLLGRKNDIDEFILDKDWGSIDFSTEKVEIPKVVIVYSDEPIKIVEKKSFHYELGKLVSNDDFQQFRLFSSLILSSINNPIVIEELENMENNYSNTLEYYSSYNYLQKVLG
jgi:hypothetical protein